MSFLDRVFAHLPPIPVRSFTFASWNHDRRPTDEGVGVMPVAGVDPEKLVACVLDVEAYPANLKGVSQVRVAERGEGFVRYWQHIHMPVLGDMQMQLLLRDHGERDGWRVVAWEQDDAATAALDPRKGVRTAYNVGAWLVREGHVAYALSSAPRREDVGRLKFAALTRGADAAASKMVQANIEAIVAWSRRR